jgi:hypothetical protein
MLRVAPHRKCHQTRHLRESLPMHLDPACAVTHASQECMQESSAAFVTMRSRLTQSVCTSGLLSYDEDLWQTHPAPSPGDIIWKHVPYRGWERSLRQVLVWGAFILLLFIYMPIVLAVQSVINLQAYQKVKAVDTLLKLPFIGGTQLSFWVAQQILSAM